MTGLAALICAVATVAVLSGCGGSEEPGLAPMQPEPSPASSFQRASEVPAVSATALDSFSQEAVAGWASSSARSSGPPHPIQ